MMWRLGAALLVVLAMSVAAFAVQPDEVLKDQALETRARAISENLRCMVCQNQSIDDSNADLARDLRLLVRERLTAGDSNQQVMDFVVSRYGEFVLLKPLFNWRNAALWATPIVLLLAGLAFAFGRARRKSGARNAALNADEQAQLDAILKARDRG